MNRSWRAAVVALGALVGVVAFAAPAAADVTVTPSAAIRGGPAQLAFHIPEERPGAYTTKVELIAPEATPIAEIYPMSVDGWAPLTKTRTLDHPVDLIHGAATTEVPSSIIWSRYPDAPFTPGEPAVLSVSLGPMPEADRVAFTIVQTYSDGTVVRWGDEPGASGAQPPHPAPVVALVDPEPNGGNADSVIAAQQGRTDGNGPYGALGSVLLVGLVAALGVEAWAILRAVHRSSLAVRTEGQHR